MGIEIERRFLAADPSWKKLPAKKSRIEQGYLIATKALSVRARIRTDLGAAHGAESGAESTITIKTFVSDQARREFEYAVPMQDARDVIELSRPLVLLKTRSVVEFEGTRFEIDEYEGDNAGLTLIEVELRREGQGCPHPAWLGPEVTADGRYSNAYLSKRPYCEWSEEDKQRIGGPIDD